VEKTEETKNLIKTDVIVTKEIVLVNNNDEQVATLSSTKDGSVLVMNNSKFSIELLTCAEYASIGLRSQDDDIPKLSICISQEGQFIQVFDKGEIKTITTTDLSKLES